MRNVYKPKDSRYSDPVPVFWGVAAQIPARGDSAKATGSPLDRITPNQGTTDQEGTTDQD
ncbi:MAG: hypothetical protein OHK0012_02170 [Synechococcales cyanobacterium]